MFPVWNNLIFLLSMRTLLDLKQGESGIIIKVKGRGAFRKRIMEMGFIVGKDVKIVRKAPLKDPVEYEIMGYNVSLRNSEAALIEVMGHHEQSHLFLSDYDGIIEDDAFRQQAVRKDKIINVALVGNPNSGKTTLFNLASGSRERVGNYSGVTVDAKTAHFRFGDYLINVVDLPGTYSITSYTPEELYVRNYIIEEVPDIVINIVDAGNLERNIYLTTQLIDMDIRVVVALNMFDELQKKGDRFDYKALGKMIGIPMVPTVASKGRGIEQLFEAVIRVFEDREPSLRHIHISYGPMVEKAIASIQHKIKVKQNYELLDRVSSRFMAIKLLEGDEEEEKRIQDQCRNPKEILRCAHHQREVIEKRRRENAETLITDAKYGFINGALKETVQPGLHARRRKSEIVDTFLTHKLFALPLFFVFLWFMFETTFSLGQYPMNWIDSGMGFLSSFVGEHMQEGMLKDMIIDGILGGIGGVIVFLPNILILFFFISLMEDSGYMARAVFIMDKLMHKIGLHGKSFIPLIMGFGCTVPAIMSTRILENRNDRMITMLINPFISCSARLPVYILFISAFFPDNHGSLLFLIYMTGIIIAILAALILKKTIFKREEVPFVMELPPYRIPTFRSITKHMWEKAWQYLRKIGGVILIASILIWALGYFPINEDLRKEYDQRISAVELNMQQEISNSYVGDSAKIAALNNQMSQQIAALDNEYSQLHQENSYIGRLGKGFQHVMAPLGFDWKMSVSIIAGTAAKEIVVSTLGVLYQVDDSSSKGNPTLVEKIRTQKYTSGSRKGEFVFNPVVALSFMIFVLLYFPCIATLMVIIRESGSYKWGLFSLVYTTVVAWIMAFLVYQVGMLIYT